MIPTRTAARWVLNALFFTACVCSLTRLTSHHTREAALWWCAAVVLFWARRFAPLS